MEARWTIYGTNRYTINSFNYPVDRVLYWSIIDYLSLSFDIEIHVYGIRNTEKKNVSVSEKVKKYPTLTSPLGEMWRGIKALKCVQPYLVARYYQYESGTDMKILLIIS